MEKHYLNADYTGSIFEYSKDPKEGYVEHTNTKGKVSYRKYYNKGVEGSLSFISLRNNEYINNREELVVSLEGTDGYYNITFPVMNVSGDAVDDYVESLIKFLPVLQKGNIYNINNWRMKKGDVINGEEVKYNRQGVTIKFAGEKMAPSLTYQTKDNPSGDIPQLEWKEIAGKNKPSAVSKEKKLEYLYGVLTQQVERLKFEKSSETSPQAQKKESPKKPELEKSFVPLEVDDDLPF